MKTVAVEHGLAPVKDYLQQQGCQVIEVNSAADWSNNAACMCITGADKNLMGIQDVEHDVPIVSCDGLTPEQVYQRVKQYIQ